MVSTALGCASTAKQEGTREPAIDQVAAMAHQVVDKAAASVALVSEWLGEQGECLNATQKKLVTDTSAYIAANPLMSAGLADDADSAAAASSRGFVRTLISLHGAQLLAFVLQHGAAAWKRRGPPSPPP
ncbi:MAG: hypothetical protein QMD17_00455 [Rhodocyclaceae bacterium]|nr:hypothetical protein [Rhodocyclaceae bacterium]